MAMREVCDRSHRTKDVRKVRITIVEGSAGEGGNTCVIDAVLGPPARKLLDDTIRRVIKPPVRREGKPDGNNAQDAV